MNRVAPLQVRRIGVYTAIALLIFYGLCHLTGIAAFICGVLFLAFTVWILSRTFDPLPRSFWWFCVLIGCVGGMGLLLVRTASS